MTRRSQLRTKRRVRRAFALLVALPLVACSRGPTPHARPIRPGPVATFDSGRIRHTVLLIGDAGAVSRDDAVLVALRRMVDEAPQNTLVVFLGDNVYEAGLPEGDGPHVERLREVLRAQLHAAGPARTIFVAGNHDWNEYRNSRTAWSAGRAAVVRQERFIADESQGRATLLPMAGCAGPESLSMTSEPNALRVIAIDSQWWLTALAVSPTNVPPSSGRVGCSARTTDEAAHELERMIAAEPARPTIVVAHHPLASNGRHGHPLLWWPFNVQDIPNRRNARFRTAVANALDSTRVLLYAAGHDHDIELFNGPGARFTVVSGAGSAAKIGRFYGNSGAPLTRDTGPGFVRVDVLRSGRIALRLVSVRQGGAQFPVCVWLAPAPLTGQSCDPTP